MSTSGSSSSSNSNSCKSSSSSSSEDDECICVGPSPDEFQALVRTRTLERRQEAEEKRAKDHVNILFPLVIRNVKEFLAKENKSEDYDYHLAPYMVLRSVSKSFRNAVDQLILDNLEKGVNGHGQKNRVSVRFHNLPMGDDAEYDKQRQKIEKIVEMKKTFDFNFFLKSMHITIFPGVRIVHLQEYLIDIQSLLGAIGDQILNFDCSIWAYSRDLLDGNVQFLREVHLALDTWARIMPNLKWLYIRFRTCTNDPEDWRRKLFNLGRFLEVKDSFVQKEFPRLQNLEKLSISMSHYFIPMDLLFRAILNGNRHVTKIAIDKTPYPVLNRITPFEKEDDDDEEEEQKLLNLTCFEANAVEFKEDGFIPLDSLEQVVHWNWPLTQLHLNTDMEKKKSVVELFRFLENFQDLQRLSLRLLQFKINFSTKIPSLSLPNLQEFECVFEDMIIGNLETENKGNANRNISFLFSFQFLLNSKNLKNLDFQIFAENFEEFGNLRIFLEKQDYTGMINIWNPGTKVEDSNIWDVFQKLKYFKVEGKQKDSEGQKYLKECRRCDRI